MCPVTKIKIKVVICVYNGGKTLVKCLDSVCSQDRQVDEVIIVNDGSTDDTHNIIIKYTDNLNIKYIELQNNVGLFRATKLGMAAVSEPSVVFRLDADDEWLPEHVSSIMSLYDCSRDDNFICGRAFTFLSDLNVISGASEEIEPKRLAKLLLWDNPLVHSAVSFDLALYDRSGGYTFDSFCLDYDLFIRMAGTGNFKQSSAVTVVYNVHANSMSRVGSEVIKLRDRALCQMRALSTLKSKVGYYQIILGYFLNFLFWCKVNFRKLKP